MTYCPRSKRGNAVVDTLLIVVVLFAFALVVILFYPAYSDLNDAIQNSTDLSNETKAVTQDYADLYPTLWDNMFLTVWVLLIMGLIVSVFLLDTYPAFMFFSVVGLIGVFVVSAFLANIFDDVISTPGISASAAQFPFTTWVMTHLLELSIAVSFLALVALYVKLRQT